MTEKVEPTRAQYVEAGEIAILKFGMPPPWEAVEAIAWALATGNLRPAPDEQGADAPI